MERLTEWCGEHAAVVNHHENYIDRLAAYEDTGLTPEEIDSEFVNKVFEENLRYHQAEADGRLVVLPCKVGDTVFCCPDEFYKKKSVTVHEFDYWMIPLVGISVFLTREEAEAALAKGAGT